MRASDAHQQSPSNLPAISQVWVGENVLGIAKSGRVPAPLRLHLPCDGLRGAVMGAVGRSNAMVRRVGLMVMAIERRHLNHVGPSTVGKPWKANLRLSSMHVLVATGTVDFPIWDGGLPYLGRLTSLFDVWCRV